MNATRARGWIKRYGAAGVLLAGCYVVLRHVAGRPSRWFAALLVVAIAGLFAALVRLDHELARRALVQSPAHRSSRAPRRADMRFWVNYDVSVAPDGNAAAVTGLWQGDENLPHRSALWTVDAFSGATRKLFDGPLYTYRVEWQPGGRAVAFCGDNIMYVGSDAAIPLATVDLATGREVTIGGVDSTTYVRFFRWSPDGKWLAYNRSSWPRGTLPSPNAGVWIASADGTRNFRLSEPAGVGCWEFAGWQPGTDKLYLSEGFPHAARRLWLASIEGPAQQLDIPATRPQWVCAPLAGSHLAIRLADPGHPGSHILHLCDLEGGSAADLGAIDQSGGVRWSRDGALLAFADHPPLGGPVKLRIRSGEAADQREYTAGRGSGYEATSIAWSPDGTRLGVGSCDDTSCGWYIVDPRAADPVRQYRGPYFPCGWRADNRLVCRGRDRIVIATESGEVTREFPLPDGP